MDEEHYVLYPPLTCKVIGDGGKTVNITRSTFGLMESTTSNRISAYSCQFFISVIVTSDQSVFVSIDGGSITNGSYSASAYLATNKNVICVSNKNFYLGYVGCGNGSIYSYRPYTRRMFVWDKSPKANNYITYMQMGSTTGANQSDTPYDQRYSNGKIVYEKSGQKILCINPKFVLTSARQYGSSYAMTISWPDTTKNTNGTNLKWGSPTFPHARFADPVKFENEGWSTNGYQFVQDSYGNPNPDLVFSTQEELENELTNPKNGEAKYYYLCKFDELSNSGTLYVDGMGIWNNSYPAKGTIGWTVPKQFKIEGIEQFKKYFPWSRKFDEWESLNRNGGNSVPPNPGLFKKYDSKWNQETNISTKENQDNHGFVKHSGSWTPSPKTGKGA